MGLFAAVGFGLLLWLWCKWCDRITPYQREMMRLNKERDDGLKSIQNDLDSGKITKDECKELKQKVMNIWIDTSYKICCKYTQIGYKK
jgi:hypothetical protein